MVLKVLGESRAKKLPLTIPHKLPKLGSGSTVLDRRPPPLPVNSAIPNPYFVIDSFSLLDIRGVCYHASDNPFNRPFNQLLKCNSTAHVK